MGRPAVGPQHPVRCTREEWAAVEQVAALTGTDRSSMARRLIVRGLKAFLEDVADEMDAGRVKDGQS